MEYVLSFILVVGLIILVHELGHFLAARAVGIRIDRFSIGFGPKIVSAQRGETEYRLSWIPLGGYVKMAGMIDESLEDIGDDFDPSDPKLFMNKKAWQKVFAISAGVIMNIVVASVILWGIYSIRGIPTYGGTVIDGTLSGYPAEAAGLQKGDRILAIDGVGVSTWEEMVALIYDRPNREIRLDFDRGGEERMLTLTTRSENAAGYDEPIGMIGINPTYEYERVGVGTALVSSWVMTWTVLREVADMVWRLITLQASLKDLSGPIGIAKMTGDTARDRGVADLFHLLALISINIGFLNILPIPALDGGHLVMVLVERVRRRPLSTRLKIWIQQVGMVLLLALIGVVVFNDFMGLR